jgi:uncharacterized integral membrane protein (TIGR00698 family)
VKPARVAPGLGVAAAGGVLAIVLHLAVPLVSALLIAIALGVVFANTVGPRASLAPGLAVASRRVLRVGVALLGFQLVLRQVLELGWAVLGVVVLVVGGGIAVTVAIGSILEVPPARRLLIACGFSICGAAAVAAADGVTDSDEDDVAVALALVVAFGSAAMLVLPALAEATGMGVRAAGAWLGGGIHEVGQVVVAGGLVGAAALQVAVVVKLARVLMLAPVLTVLSWQRRRSGALTSGRRPPLVPFFVVAFVALVALGSVLPVPDLLRAGVAQVQGFALATAMFALGCAIDVGSMRRLRSSELLLGLLSTVSVALLALPLVAVVSG